MRTDIRRRSPRCSLSGRHALLLATAWLIVVARWSTAAEQATDRPAAAPSEAPDAAAAVPPPLPPPEHAKRLAPRDAVWVDPKQKLVYVDGFVSLREGYLEMFACLVGTKEHESIVALDCKAETVHAALLSVGAVSGRPVQFQPKFVPASGDVIEIEIRWRDKSGKWQSARAQDWVQNLRTKKPMTDSWVFGGSGFWEEKESGRRRYMAEAGDVICVANFITAMLDLPTESSQSAGDLLYGAAEKKIPPIGTPVRLVLRPVKNDKNVGVSR